MRVADRLISLLGGLSKPLLLVFSLLFVAATSVLDYIALDFSFIIFDTVPVFVSSWFVGTWAGVFVSFASALSWLAVDFIETPAHSNPLVHIWNAAAQFGLLALMSYFLTGLKSSLARERELARRDPLTGALNGRAFFELARRELNRSRRYKEVFTFAYMDIDDFKTVNDRYGHAEGDALLRAASDTIKGNLRNVDFIARLGGDEFAIMLPETDHKGAAVVMPRLRDLLAGAMRKNGWPATFSIGVVTYKTPPDTIDALIRRADALMYEAKSAGKDMIKYEVNG